jgi:hypothetical protein
MNDVDDDKAAFMNYEEGGGVIISLSLGRVEKQQWNV